MKATEYPLKKFTIKYDYEKKLFFLWDVNNVLVDEHVSGRELGRQAWDLGAEAVCHDYDLGLTEPIK